MTTEEFLNVCGVEVSEGRPATGGNPFVPWRSIHGHPLEDELLNWLNRQTTSVEGPWVHDVVNFFEHKLKGIKVPVCLD